MTRNRFLISSIDEIAFHSAISSLHAALQFDVSRDDRDDVSRAIARKALSLTIPRIKTAQERIAELIGDLSIPLPTLPGVIEQEIRSLERTIGQDLTAAMTAGQLAGAANAITSLPDVYVPPATTAGAGSDVPPTAPPSFGSLLPDDDGESEYSFPVVDEAVETLSNARVFTSTDYRQVAEQARQGAFGISGDLTEGAVERVRNILAENIASGADREAFTEQVLAAVEGQLSEAHVEQIFRTNVMSAFSDGADKALEQPMVADAFPYRQYWATTDQRTRPEHRALERMGIQGTNIYRADDPVFRRFRPPWDFNCRCSWNPVTVEQAANQGITEAKEWLARAKAMADAKGGPWPAYLNATAPQTPTWVQPPPFEPPPEFARM